jgi:energy-coupling factor transport system permease protein
MIVNKNIHVLTITIMCLALIILLFSYDNPIILLTVTLLFFAVFYKYNSVKKIAQGLIYFIPFMFITVIINMIFVWNGRTILFYILHKPFTLEALIYAIILSYKLLLIIYLFMIINLLVDSDTAVSYFSNKMPKSTLTFMIAMKLFPAMKEKIHNLKLIYTVRGVNFNDDKTTNLIKSYMPILSVLLENTLEGAFDIGEAAYVRGFLSSKRSIYEKQILKKRDIIIILINVLLILLIIFCKFKSLYNIDIYQGLRSLSLINKFSVIATVLIISEGLIIYM